MSRAPGERLRSRSVRLSCAYRRRYLQNSTPGAPRRAISKAGIRVHAAIHHAWFERIHPFVDGNGRVGRLLLNFMLLQHGYPPAVILKGHRPRYLRGLARADADNPNVLTEVIARAVSGTLTRFLIPALAGDAKLVPLSALASSSPYSAAYLLKRVLAGKLRAVRDGRLWLSSRAWLADYTASRDPRGARPKKRARGRARRSSSD
jgi:cell filamentation protein, protein adenylyltransferase